MVSYLRTVRVQGQVRTVHLLTIGIIKHHLILFDHPRQLFSFTLLVIRL